MRGWIPQCFPIRTRFVKLRETLSIQEHPVFCFHSRKWSVFLIEALGGVVGQLGGFQDLLHLALSVEKTCLRRPLALN
jgi:hypothetical protein